jgi:hypothetical protein
MTVINLRTDTLPPNWKDNPQYIYIGRANRAHGGLKQSIWHNPHKLKPDASAEERQQVIELYTAELLANPDLLRQIPMLRGKTLVCWCHPLPCHGHKLAERAALSDEELGRLIDHV